MALSRQDKKEVIDQLKSYFSSSAGSFLVNYKGLSVAEVQGLRAKLRQQGGKMHVTKARLMRIAAQDFEDVQGFDQYFKDQIALVFADEQPAAIAKILFEEAKQNNNLNIIAGCVEAKCLDEEGIKFLATLPSREVLLARLAGVLSAPATQLARLLNNIIGEFVLTLKAIEQKKQ